MKIYIGPYTNYVGVYQIADWLQKVGVSEERCDKIGEYLSKTWLNKFCEWVESKRKRTMIIKIDNYDVWSADHTLALIILPVLKKLKEVKHGAPNTEDSDVPDGLGLRSTEAPKKEHDWDTDGNIFKRWDWIMDEMIWTFEQLCDSDSTDQFYEHSEDKTLSFTERIHALKIDREGLKKHEDRIDNGLRLFGKYFQALWD